MMMEALLRVVEDPAVEGRARVMKGPAMESLTQSTQCRIFQLLLPLVLIQLTFQQQTELAGTSCGMASSLPPFGQRASSLVGVQLVPCIAMLPICQNLRRAKNK